MRPLLLLLMLSASLGLFVPALAQKKVPDNFDLAPPSNVTKLFDRINAARAHTSGLSLGIGMHMTLMQNAAFGSAIERGKVSHEYSFAHTFSAMGMRATILPFIIDLSFFSSVPHSYTDGVRYAHEYEVRDNGTGLNVTVVDTLTAHQFRNRGASLAFSVAAFSFFKVLYPYVGIGYSLSQIGEGAKLAPDNNKIVASTSAPFWKVGIAIHPWRRLIITAEYASSVNQLGGLKINSGRDFATAEFSLRYQFVKFHKK